MQWVNVRLFCVWASTLLLVICSFDACMCVCACVWMWGEQIGLATVILHIWPKKSKSTANELNWIEYIFLATPSMTVDMWKSHRGKRSIHQNGMEMKWSGTWNKRRVSSRCLYCHKSNMLCMQIYWGQNGRYFICVSKVTNRQGREKWETSGWLTYKLKWNEMNGNGCATKKMKREETCPHSTHTQHTYHVCVLVWRR